MNISVKVRKMINNGKPLKAVCSVTLDKSFAIHGVRLIETEKKRFIAMPAENYKDDEGNEKSRDVCHPINAETRKAIEEAVYDAYEARFSEDVERNFGDAAEE